MSWDKITKVIAGIGGAIAGVFGEWNTMLTILACVMVIDYITGVTVAIAHKSPKTANGGVSSKAGFEGLLRKFIIILIVAFATVFDRVLGTERMIFQTACTFYYIANEGISILENASLLGVPFPAGMKNALEAMKEKNNDTTLPEAKENKEEDN